MSRNNSVNCFKSAYCIVVTTCDIKKKKASGKNFKKHQSVAGPSMSQVRMKGKQIRNTAQGFRG